jgi:hypothetical protein
MWHFAKVRAENELAFPTPEKMDHFRNMWVRLIPDPMHDDMQISETEYKFVETEDTQEQQTITPVTPQIDTKVVDKVLELEKRLEELLTEEPNTNERILNLTEPQSSSETPNPADASYYVGDDYIYVYINGKWKRHSIYNW